MVIYRTYVEDVTRDPDDVARGFLHPDNRGPIRYREWLSAYWTHQARDGWLWGAER